MKRILDLGCGTNKEPGSIGVDLVALRGVDIVVDLQSCPYPFLDSSFDNIILNDVIEHLPNTITVMEELYRICKSGARVNIRVVNWSSHYAFEDPTHVKYFTEHSFDFFGTYKLRSYYSKARFDVIRCDRQFNAAVEKKIKNKRLLKFLGNYLTNVLEGFHFELEAKKDEPPTTPPPYTHNDIFEFIVCPHCLRDLKRFSKLTIRNRAWLACTDQSCQYKFPIIHGTPILIEAIGAQWASTPMNELPVPSLNQRDYSIAYTKH